MGRAAFSAPPIRFSMRARASSPASLAANWMPMPWPRPGVPASSGYLAQVLQTLQTRPVRFVIRAAYEDPRSGDFIAQRAHIPAITLPFTVGGTPAATDLFTLYDDTITRLLSGIGQ